jgi:peptide methionine sulfoxide reductase MsrA
VIFTESAEQQAIAQQVVAEMQSAFDEPIVTQIVPLDTFYKAEDYHQNYYRSNPSAGYCQAVISPKLSKARALFREKLKT